MKKYFSPIGKKSKVLFLISIFTVLLFASCSKEDVSPNAGNAVAQSPVKNTDMNSLLIDKTTPPLQAVFSPSTLPVMPPNSVIFIGHGSCLGTCPVYSVTAYPNGHIVFQGFNNVAHMGTIEFGVSRELIYRLEMAMIQMGFLKFKSQYEFVLDLSQSITALRADGDGNMTINPKIVVDYSFNVPQDLISIRNMIETALHIDKLVNDKDFNAQSVDIK